MGHQQPMAMLVITRGFFFTLNPSNSHAKVPNRDIAVRLASPGIVVGQAGPWCKKRDGVNWCQLSTVKIGIIDVNFDVISKLSNLDAAGTSTLSTCTCIPDYVWSMYRITVLQLAWNICRAAPEKPLCWCFMTAIRLCESLQWQVMVWEGTENHITSWQIQTYFVDLQHLEIFRVHLKSCIS